MISIHDSCWSKIENVISYYPLGGSWWKWLRILPWKSYSSIHPFLQLLPPQPHNIHDVNAWSQCLSCLILCYGFLIFCPYFSRNKLILILFSLILWWWDTALQMRGLSGIKDRVLGSRYMTDPCFYHMRDLRHIWGHLDLDSAKLLATALMSSHLDYRNSLFYGIADIYLARLHCGPPGDKVSSIYS